MSNNDLKASMLPSPLPSMRVADALVKHRVLMRKMLPIDTVQKANAESKARVDRFVKLVIDEKAGSSHQLFQKLLILEIVDAYHKGRFET